MIVTMQNPGLIDLRAVQYMGVNVKKTSDAIGYFGTGLKYAIATLLRHNQKITLWRGLEKFEFTSESEVIRGKAFNLVKMNGQGLGMTTDLGKNWQMWMAFRELYSNMLDERGTASPVAIEPSASTTTIQIEGADFYDQYTQRGEIFLHDQTPLYENEFVSIYKGESKFAFYRGVRTNALQKPTRFTYSVKTKLDLTEDRTVSNFYTWSWQVAFGILTCLDQGLIEKAVAKFPDTNWEHDADFNHIMPHCSEQFLDAIEALGRRNCNEHAVEVWRRSERAKGIPEFEEMPLSTLDSARLDRAVKFLRRLGYEADYPVKVSSDLGHHIQGLARDDTIWIAHPVFDKGTKNLASVIYEEWVHLKFGFRDHSYDMQTFLFDKILTLVEELNGEPL